MVNLMLNIAEPELEFFCDLQVQLGAPIEIGAGSAGRRRIIPIVGGTVSGPHFEGKILNLGADWQTQFTSGTAHLDTRYALETLDGATIEIINRGFRHGPPEVIAALAAGEDVPADAYYMRTHATLETGDERYSWINNHLFVGTGARNQSSVDMRLFVLR
jgi:hypothetical protein